MLILACLEVPQNNHVVYLAPGPVNPRGHRNKKVSAYRSDIFVVRRSRAIDEECFDSGSFIPDKGFHPIPRFVARVLMGEYSDTFINDII